MAMLSPPCGLDAIGGHNHQWAFSSGAGAMGHGEERAHAQRPPMWLSTAKPILYASWQLL